MSATSTTTIRELLASTRPRVSSEGYPPYVRAQAVRAAVRRHREGASWEVVSRELGIARGTLCAWVADAQSDPAQEPPLGGSSTFLPVVIADEEPGRGSGVDAAGLTVVTPRGYRLEGLDLDAAAALLERLG